MARKYRSTEIHAGQLNKKITVLKPKEGTNAAGSTVIEMKPWKRIWAGIWPLKGKEALELKKLRPELSHKIIMRYREDITPDLILEYKGRQFEIVSALNPLEANVKLELLCTEIVKKGAALNVDDL